MVKKIIVLFVVLLVFVVGMVAWGVSAPSTQAQSNLKAVTGWAWSSNIGWVNFAPGGTPGGEGSAKLVADNIIDSVKAGRESLHHKGSLGNKREIIEDESRELHEIDQAITQSKVFQENPITILF